MSNIEQLKAQGEAARVTWAFGDDALPLRSDGPTSIAADDVRQAEERTRYARAAIAGEPDTLADALRWNEDRTIAMVERLAVLDKSPSMTGDEFRVGFRLLLSDVIHKSAEAHAKQRAENGWPL
jgi:hypothetical protein